MPPYLIDMRIRPKDGQPFRIWLPLFLLWPLLLVLAVLALVLTLLVDIALWAFGQDYHYYTLFTASVFGLLSDLRGMTVYITDASTLVDVVIK